MIQGENFADMPYGVRGETTPVGPPEPALPIAQPFRPDPPNWELEAKERAAREAAEPPAPTPPAPAIVAVMGGEYDPPPVGPPVVDPPLERPRFPAPDWRAEERERARRTAAENQDLLEPPAEHYPAKRRAS